MRTRVPTTPLTRALSNLTSKQIDSIGEFSAFAETVKSLNSEEVVAFVQELTGSRRSLTEIQEQVCRAVSHVNDSVPFIFPLRVDRPSQITILHIQEDISVLSSDTALIRLTTTQFQWRHYLIQRSSHPRGYHKSVLTLSNIFFLIRTMLQRTYTARCRNLTLFPGQLFEIGAGVTIIQLLTPPLTFETLFKQVTMMSCSEWLSKHVRTPHGGTPRFPPYDQTAPTISPRVPYSDQSLLRLSDAGRASIESFPVDALQRRMMGRLSDQSYLQVRQRLVNSLGVSCFIRHVFNAPYPSMVRAFGNTSNDCVPLVHLDFDHGMITAVDPSPFAAFRLSPNFVHAAGTALSRDLFLSMAIVAQAFTENIESIRGYLEAMIGDEDFTAGRQRSVADMVHTRTLLEAKFLAFAPPKLSATDPTVGTDWLLRIERFLDDSSNAAIQPIEAIPWF
jgi:hypothetical protein